MSLQCALHLLFLLPLALKSLGGPRLVWGRPGVSCLVLWGKGERVHAERLAPVVVGSRQCSRSFLSLLYNHPLVPDHSLTTLSFPVRFDFLIVMKWIIHCCVCEFPKKDRIKGLKTLSFQDPLCNNWIHGGNESIVQPWPVVCRRLLSS